MIRIRIITALAFAALATAASAQQQTIYDASGKVVGRSATHSSGTVTTSEMKRSALAAVKPAGFIVTVVISGLTVP